MGVCCRRCFDRYDRCCSFDKCRGIACWRRLVTLGAPKRLNPILEVKLTEVMTLPLPETAEGSLALEAKSHILEAVERTKSVLAIGPGLSQHPETVALVHSLICESDTPTVIDADGINALSQSKEVLSSLSPQTVLTPHPGEMARLIGGTVEALERDRIGIAQRFAETHNVTLVLKGRRRSLRAEWRGVD